MNIIMNFMIIIMNIMIIMIVMIAMITMINPYNDSGLHKKISNLGPEKKLMTNLPKRPPVDIEFNNLSYSGEDDDDEYDEDDDEKKSVW